MQMTGSIVEVLRNDKDLYDGDLSAYFRALFYRAQNMRNPYHNLRHMLHVAWLCYQAVQFYIERGRPLNRRDVRNLLIAALFHDFDHAGQFGDDDLNIERAIRGLRKNIQPEDVEALPDIEAIIKATEYPHKAPSDQLDLCAQILRDADVSQALSVAWIQQVIIGLATEWSKPPLDVLRAQGGFHRSLKLTTQWARELFPEDVILEKVAEAEALLELLGDPPKA